MKARNLFGHVAFLISIVGVVSAVAAVLMIGNILKLTGIPSAISDTLFLVWLVAEVAAFIIGIVS